MIEYMSLVCVDLLKLFGLDLGSVKAVNVKPELAQMALRAAEVNMSFERESAHDREQARGPRE